MKSIAGTEDARKLIHEGIQVMSKTSIQGMKIDVEYCVKQEKYLGKKIKVLKNDFAKSKIGRKWKKEYLSPNFNSDQQLRNILFNKYKLPIIKRTDPSKAYPEGQPSVDNECLDILSKTEPDLKSYAEYKKYSKVLKTYIQGILKEQVNGTLYPFFHLNTTATFRGSSSAINFQNQPNRDKKQKRIVRSAFIPSPGNQLLTGDFTGIEVAISACNHKDPKMLDYVRHPEINNMHTDMAIQCFLLDVFLNVDGEEKLRKGTKNGFVFPQFYGDYYLNNAPVLCDWAGLPLKGSFSKKDGVQLMTGMKIGEHLIKKNIYSFDDFVEHIKGVEDDFWNNRFRKYKKWKEKKVKEYYEKGFLKTLTGFTCSGLLTKNQITNYPIQGPAFHCLLKTYIELFNRLQKYKMKSRLIGQIHDEMVLDAHPKEREYILEMMQEIACVWLLKQWKWIIVPLEIEAAIFEPDANWAQKAEKMKIAA